MASDVERANEVARLWLRSCWIVADGVLADSLTREIKRVFATLRQEERERAAALVQKFPHARPNALAAAIRRGEG